VVPRTGRCRWCRRGPGWAELVGGEIAFISDDFVAVKADQVWLAAVRVPDHKAPTWSEGDLAKQMQLDLDVEDLDGAEAEARRLGGPSR
jgi:tmRNA-binding protein